MQHPIPDRYFALIDRIVTATLEGNIRSKAQVFRMLAREIEPATGEVFEECLRQRLQETQARLDAATDEMKQAKANRILRALQTIQGEWQRWTEENQATSAIATSVQQLMAAPPQERPTLWLRIADPNQAQAFKLSDLEQLATALKQTLSLVSDPQIAEEIRDLAAGIARGSATWQRLQGDVVSWMYEGSRGGLGFGGGSVERQPWATWARAMEPSFVQQVMRTLAMDGAIADCARQAASLSLADWVELTLVLQYLQQGLVSWFEQQPYDSKWGRSGAIAAFLTFAVLWCQLASGLSALPSLARGSFQGCLQVLRAFSQRPYFPLYGGVFALFSGDALRDTLAYFDEPLRQVDGTQEKARILTLLGYSHRAIGQYERAGRMHQQALEIARTADDRPCEIANLNHLSRLALARKDYEEAIATSQRALILARETGDKLGEANALTNAGYSEVLAALARERPDPDTYERAVATLTRGLKLAEQQGDRQTQALGFSSLGIARLMLEEPEGAIADLERGVQAAQMSGDLYLQGLNLAYLAEAHHRLGNGAETLEAACLGAYYLEQIGAQEWRQPAGLLVVLRGRLGEESFLALIQQQRSKLVRAIGVDGCDYLPELLRKYNEV